MPTVAELRTRRLDVTRASIRERILAGDLDDVRVVVDTLAQEFDIVDIAAAAVKLAHQAEAGDEAERDIPVVVAHERPAPRGFRPDRESGPPASRFLAKGRWSAPRVRASSGAIGRSPPKRSRCCLSARGGRPGIRPGDLVGAITGEAGINSRELGAIEIADRFSLVESAPRRARTRSSPR